MSYNRFENVSLDNPLPCKEVSGTYTRFEDVSESNPWPVVVIDADAYTDKEDVSEANPQPIALDTGDTYTRFEELSDTNRKPVVIVEGQSYDPKQPVSMTNPWPVIDASPAPSYTGPLDLVPGAVVAYGQRALAAADIGSAVYTIRRDSDDATQAFNSQANGGVDVAAITAFLGGANGFIPLWNDKSGNGYDQVQATAGSQMGWFTGVADSIPGIGNGDSALASAQLALSAGTPLHIFAVESQNEDDDCFINVNNGFDRSFTTYENFNFHEMTTTNTFSSTCDAFAENETVGLHLYEFVLDASGVITFLVDGVNISLTEDPPVPLGTDSYNCAIGYSGGFRVCEVIVYPSTLSAPNALAVRQNIADYYGITLP